MNKTILYTIFAFCTFIFSVLFFCVPTEAEVPPEEYCEYVVTLGSGESYSLKGIAYGKYRIDRTCVGTMVTPCSYCNGSLYGAPDNTSYVITVDGAKVFSYCSATAGEGIIDFTAYSDSDAQVKLPQNYSFNQNYKCNSCGNISPHVRTVTGTLELYGYKNIPMVTIQPQSVQAETDGMVEYKVAGEKTVAYRWQKLVGAAYQDLYDGETNNGISYSGTASPTLKITGIRLADNGSLYRCALIGENGDVVYSDPAGMSVSDTSGPVVKLSLSPSSDTTDDVSVLISAKDMDGTLHDTPYYYQNKWQSEPCFSVSSNGIYEVMVRDQLGNVTTQSVTVSNIKPKSIITPTPTQVPTATPGQLPTAVPTTYPTSVPTQAALVPLTTSVNTGNGKSNSKSNSANESKKEKEKATTDSDEHETKKVNIRNLTNTGTDEKLYNGYKEGEQKTEEIEIKEELAEPPIEEVDENILTDEGPDYLTLGIILGSLFLVFVVVILAMILPVRLDVQDDFGNWSFSTLRFLRYRKGWQLKVDELLEDYDVLRLRFGSLFLLMCNEQKLQINLAEGETLAVPKLKQNIVIAYQDVRRK